LESFLSYWFSLKAPGHKTAHPISQLGSPAPNFELQAWKGKTAQVSDLCGRVQILVGGLHCNHCGVAGKMMKSAFGKAAADYKRTGGRGPWCGFSAQRPEGDPGSIGTGLLGYQRQAWAEMKIRAKIQAFCHIPILRCDTQACPGGVWSGRCHTPPRLYL